MSNEQTIDKLSIEIDAKAKKMSGMEKLIASIEKLKAVTGGGTSGLTGVSGSIQKLVSILDSAKGKSGTVSSLANSIKKLNEVKTNAINSNIKTLTDSLQSLNGMGSGLKTIVADLGAIAKSGGGSTAMNALKLQAQVAKTQATVDKSALTSAKAHEGLQAIADKNAKIAESAKWAAEAQESLNDAVKRAVAASQAVETPKLYNGAISPPVQLTGSSLATDISSLQSTVGMNVSSNARQSTGFIDRMKNAIHSAKNKVVEFGNSAKTAFSSANSQVAKFTKTINFAATYMVVRRAANTIGGFINNINSYMEDMNLFAVAMSDAADEGESLAQSMQDILGIDAGEAMRNMGLFQQLETSFGVINSQATTVSKNLTQLGYDLSSFYNISSENMFLKLQSGLAGEVEPLRRIGIDISKARLQQELYNLGIDATVDSLSQADKSLLRYIAIMRQTTNAQGDMARTLSAPSNQIRILTAQLQIAGRAIGSIFIPALNAILPSVIAVVQIIGEAASAIAKLFGFEMPKVDYSSVGSGLSGIADDTADVSSGLDDIGDSAKGAEKDVRNLISGFDELNILQMPSDGSGKDKKGKSGMGTGNILGDIELPQYDMLSGAIDSRISDIKDRIKKSLAEITAIVSVALLAVGAILLLTGANIPLGLGLMAVGAAGLASTVALNWDSMSESLLGVLTTLTTALGGFSLVLGATLAFTGANIPLGIGLMVVGAASLAAAVAINWNSTESGISTAISGITGLVSGASLALGALFCLTGVDAPLGIGLLLVGAVGLASTIALNWGDMSDKTRETLSTITGIVSASMLALGAILTLTGAAPALGIPMMVTGAAMLASTVAINWNGMSDKLRTTLTVITSIVGTGLLALGAILTFTGANIPLGIGMMISGAVSLATAVSLNWNSMSNEVKNQIAIITGVASTAAVAIGLILCLTGAGIPLGLALIAGGVGGLFGSAKMGQSNSLENEVSGMIDGVNGQVPKAKDAGGNISKGIYDGALDQLQKDKQKWYQWSWLPWNWFKEKNEINSPSRLFTRGGRFISQGLFGGADSDMKNNKSKWASWGLNPFNWFKESNNGKFKTEGGNIIDQLKGGISSKISGLKSWWNNNTKFSAFKIPEISEPRVKLPHFSLSYEYSSWAGKALKFLGLPGFPKLNVSWYAKGGVFDNESIIGVGEYANAKSNPEIVTPQKIMRETMDEANKAVIAAVNSNSSGTESESRMVELMRMAFVAAMREAGNSEGITIINQMDSDTLSKKTYKIQQKQGRKFVTAE